MAAYREGSTVNGATKMSTQPSGAIPRASARSGREEHLPSKALQRALINKGDEFRARHPQIIQHQDRIGFAIFSISCLAIVLNAVAYAMGVFSGWVAIVIAAFWMSILHELEHDLIHYMYYRKNPFMHNLMMAGVWLFRPSTISPWVRRSLHLHHHKVSGSAADIEERGITNGVPWGLKRLLMLGDHMLAIYLRPLDTLRMMRAYVRSQEPLSRGERLALVRQNMLAYFPLGMMHYALWHGLVVWHVFKWSATAMGYAPVLSETQLQVEQVVNFLAVVLLIPNVLRVFCLHFVSSNMHYYGDVEPGNVIQQTQVWNRWWLAPLHVFCFNFGATHAIHHFVVRDPFYVRQWTARQMYPLMREYGVRFNDFGTFRRANRFDDPSSVATNVVEPKLATTA